MKKIMIIMALVLMALPLNGCGKFMDSMTGGDPKSEVAVTGDGNVVSVGGEGNTTTSTTTVTPTPAPEATE